MSSLGTVGEKPNWNAMNSKAGDKENKNLLHVRKQVIAPSLQSLDEKNNQNGDILLVENKSKDEARYIPQRPCRPTDYNTAKLKYKATKARASTRESIDHSRVVSMSTISSVVKVQPPAKTPPTVESGLNVLGLIRPLDNKTFEFGLAEGIKLHLVENVKLCGLKKCREKSLLDMVMTLCNHLASRELEIERWAEFSDTVALASAERLDQAKHEYISICCAKDDALNAVQTMLVNVGKEVLCTKKEVSKTRAEVADILSTAFPSILCDVKKLRHQIQRYCSDMRSECKSETRRATDKLTTAHYNDKRRLENVIDRLELQFRVEEEKVKSLQCQLIDTAASLKNEQKEQQQIRDDLQRAHEQIKSLELLVENERVQKAKEIRYKDEQMRVELDTIDQKVKNSIKSLIESKTKAVEEARKLKAQLECRSKINQK